MLARKLDVRTVNAFAEAFRARAEKAAIIDQAHDGANSHYYTTGYQPHQGSRQSDYITDSYQGETETRIGSYYGSLQQEATKKDDSIFSRCVSKLLLSAMTTRQCGDYLVLQTRRKMLARRILASTGVLKKHIRLLQYERTSRLWAPRGRD